MRRWYSCAYRLILRSLNFHLSKMSILDDDEDLKKCQRPVQTEVVQKKQEVVNLLGKEEADQRQLVRRQAERRAWDTFFCLSVWCG